MPEEIEVNEFDINAHFGLDDHTMVIDNFPDPFIGCTFITNDLLYVNFFYAPKCIHHSFIFNHVTRAVTSHIEIQMKMNHYNFPYKCFYSSKENEVYSFYRHG